MICKTTKYLMKFLLLVFLLNLKLNADNNSDKLFNSKLDSARVLFENNDVKCIVIAEEAYQISKDSKNLKYQVQSKELLAKAYKTFGFHQKAIENIYDALTLNEKLKDKPKIAENYRMLGEVNRAAMLYNQSLNYLKTALKIFTEIKDSVGIAKTYNRMGSVYSEIFNSINVSEIRSRNLYADSTLNYIFKSNMIANIISFKKLLISNYSILGAFYNASKNTDSSLYYFDKALEQCKDFGLISELPEILISKADLLNNVKRNDEALVCAKKISELNKHFKNTNYEKAVYNIEYECYWVKGEFEKALKILDSVRKLEVIIFDKILKTNTNIVSGYYENLRNAEQLEMAKSNFKKTIIFAVIIFSLFLTIILILRKSNKKHKNLNSELQYANATKDKFFAIIAHDLKNPIGSFKSITELMNDEFENFSNDEIKGLVELMKNSAHNITELLENLLTWSKAQRNTISFNPEHNYLSHLVKHNISLLEPLAKNKNIKIINEINESDLCFCDANMLNTIIRNIATNAVKFTPNDGKITFSSKIINIGKNKFTEFSISDTGVGISENTLKSLFEIGESHSTEGTSGEKGTGLGLIICKEFIDKHQGKIWAESTQGFGSTIKFQIPLREYDKI